MNVFDKNIFPLADRNSGLNSIREVLIVVRVLNLLNNFRRFTNIINKLTCCLGNRSNIKNTLSDIQGTDSTRRLRDNTRYFLTRLKITSIINNLNDSRTDLPTFVCGNITSCSRVFKRLTLVNKFTFKESGSNNICSCSTTERCGLNLLTTSTSVSKCQRVAKFCVSFRNSNLKLIIFKRVCRTSNSIICCASIQSTNSTRCDWELSTITSVYNIQCNLSTILNTMREGELQQTKVKVDDIVKGRLQFNCRSRRISSTRIFDFNLIKTTVLDRRLSNSARTATTSNNNCRCLGITRTRIGDSDAVQDASSCQLSVDGECDFRT
ncbi:hypothetical protein SBM1_00223 [Synechococcus phage S-BM1]|nr:hypothetical protein SBM1_00223 [Synechococcus phage S-BM1]